MTTTPTPTAQSSGAGLEHRQAAAHVSPDGRDSRVRRARQRSLLAGADARPHAPLPGRRGRGRRHLRSAAAGRLRHQHAPRPRALPGQGRDARSDVCRTARQGSRVLQGQGRLDAHRRPGHRESGRQRHRGRQRRNRHRGCVRVEATRATGASASASSARARWGKACSTK